MSLRVLIIDDETAILSSLQRTLRPLQVVVTACSDPVEALVLCQRESFDLVISDQRMPNLTGIELLRKVQQLQPQCSRMILSGYTDFDCVVGAFNDGVIEKFIGKPWDDTELKQLVTHRIERLESTPSEPVVVQERITDELQVCDEIAEPAAGHPALSLRAREQIKRYRFVSFRHYYRTKSLCRIDWEIPTWLWSSLFWDSHSPWEDWRDVGRGGRGE
ncbi:response regulator [Dongshaea marina]|uniref:response regulator n=1 Tax=Dongshaea marina TaxID=2047966 RepID=UPI000D3E9A0F|nr:response regulator [Dongshaea marina]